MKAAKLYRWLAYGLVTAEMLIAGRWPEPGVQEFLWVNGFLALAVPCLYPYALRSVWGLVPLAGADLAAVAGTIALLPGFPHLALFYLVSPVAMIAAVRGFKWGLAAALSFFSLSAGGWLAVGPSQAAVAGLPPLAAALIVAAAAFSAGRWLILRGEVDRARLREAVEANQVAGGQLDALFELATDVRTEGGLEEVAISLVNSVRSLLGSEDAALILSPAGEAAAPKIMISSRGENPGRLPDWFTGRIRGCGRAFCPAQSSCRGLLSEESRPDGLKPPGEVLCAPLLAQSLALGAVFAYRPTVRSGHDHVKFLHIAAGLGAAAIRNLVAAREIKGFFLSRERKRIAEEINDGLGKTILASLGELDRARQAVRSAPTEAERLMGQVQNDLTRGLKDVRRFIYDLRPLSIAGGGLEKSLESYFKRFQARYRIQTVLEVTGEASRLRPAVCETIFRLVQEATLTLAKRSRAGRIEVRIKIGPTVALSITGDAGISPEQLMDSEPSFGLSLLAERAGALGGSLKVEPLPGGGAALLATLPAGGGVEGWSGSESLSPTITG